MDAVVEMKKHILFGAVVFVLFGLFSPLGICQNQGEVPGVTLPDCPRTHEAARKLPDLRVEQISIAPGSEKSSEKTTNPKIGIAQGEVRLEKIVVSGRPSISIARHAGDEGCILREDWENTQASVDNEK